MSYSSEVLADNPLAYYRLGEASGAVLIDSSGNGRNGAYVGSSTALGTAGLLVGDADTAATFNSSTPDRATVGYDVWMVPAQFTAEAWFNPASVSGRHMVFGHASNAGGAVAADYSWQIEWNGTTVQTNLFTTVGSDWTMIHAAGLVVGQAHHVALAWDGAVMRLFFDGALVSSKAKTGSLWSANSEVMSIGADSDGRYLRASGTIDEAAFYGTALTAERIAAHYAAGIAATPDPPMVVAGGSAHEAGFAHEGTVALPSPPSIVVAGGTAHEVSDAYPGTTTLAPAPMVVVGGTAHEVDGAHPGTTTVARPMVVAGGTAHEVSVARAGSVVRPGEVKIASGAYFLDSHPLNLVTGAGTKVVILPVGAKESGEMTAIPAGEQLMLFPLEWTQVILSPLGGPLAPGPSGPGAVVNGGTPSTGAFTRTYDGGASDTVEWEEPSLDGGTLSATTMDDHDGGFVHTLSFDSILDGGEA